MKAEAGNSNSNSNPTAADVDSINNSSYATIRLILLHLRPLFLQVLQIPDFQNSEAANGIRKGLKHVMDLYRHMQIEGNQTWKIEKEHLDGLLNKGTQEKVPQQSADHKPSNLPINTLEMLDDAWPRGSYIAGGSVSEWNFITFVNRNPPEYYGVTKQSFRLKS